MSSRRYFRRVVRSQIGHELLDVAGPAGVFDAGAQERVEQRGHLAGGLAPAFLLEVRRPELGVALLVGCRHAVADRLDQQSAATGVSARPGWPGLARR